MRMVRKLAAKRVSFQTDERGDVLRQTCPIPHQRTLSKEEIAECWWSDDEMNAIKLSAMALRSSFLENSDYTGTCRELLLRCSTREYFGMEEDLLVTIVDSDARGLEFHTIRLLQHRQSRATLAVLDCQERLRYQVDWKQLEHMLALQYRRSSMYASEWARMVAIGDEIFIRTIWL